MNILLLYGFAPHTTANYLARAFAALGHDVRSAGTVSDLRGWANPYRLWRHAYPLDGGQVLELGDWRPDLAVWVESGDPDLNVLDSVDAPLAGWFIDTHNAGKFDWHKRLAPRFDHLFCAMRPAVEQLPGAHWLPLACDPEIHTPRTTEKRYDLGWVGGDYRTSSLYRARFEAMRKLQGRYTCHFASGVYFEDMADVYGQARIGWHMSVMGADLDMRPFEVLCSGTPLVMDHAVASGFQQLQWGAGGFERDTGKALSIPIWTYESEGEMFDEIDWLLSAGEGMRQRIGSDGREAVLAAHTYQHRALAVLEVVGG